MRKSVDIDHKSQYSTRGREAAARLVQPRGKLSHSFPTWHGRVKYWIRHQGAAPVQIASWLCLAADQPSRDGSTEQGSQFRLTASRIIALRPAHESRI